MTNALPGWNEYPSAPAIPASQVRRAHNSAVSLISDVMARTAGATGILPFHAAGLMAGTVVTVKTRSGDNLAIYRAFAACRPGDVLVVDGGGILDQALVGEIMTTYAESIGLAGVVLDGAIRDVAAIRRRTYPVFARGVSHRGPYKDGPGEINVPVSIGGMVVCPGDLIVGDDDGLVAIRPNDVDTVLTAAEEKADVEAASLRAIADGTYSLAWVDEHFRSRQP